MMAPEYCFLWINWWATCMQKSEWAAWMQAIFSVMAIGGAIAIAWWQRKEERRHNALRDRALGEVVADSVLLSAADWRGWLTGSVVSWQIQFESAGHLSNLGKKIEEMKKMSLPTGEELMQLANVWPLEARVLVTARSQILALQVDMERYRQQTLNGITPLIVNAEELIDLAQDTVELLGRAHAGIRPKQHPIG